MENMVKLNPHGGQGTRWDEKGNTDIVQILISHGSSEVNSIQFVYVVDEKVVPSEMYGKPLGLKFDIVTFNYPEEYLVSVSGSNQNGLASIAFDSNKRKYGPFGMVDSQYSYENFAFNFRPKSSFGGFHGSVSSARIYSIGVYVRPLEYLSDIETDAGCDKE